MKVDAPPPLSLAAALATLFLSAGVASGLRCYECDEIDPEVGEDCPGGRSINYGDKADVSAVKKKKKCHDFFF